MIDSEKPTLKNLISHPYKNIKNAGFKTQLELNDFFQIIKESLFGKNFNIEKVNLTTT